MLLTQFKNTTDSYRNSNQEVRQFMSKINHISSFKNEGTAAWNFFTERCCYIRFLTKYIKHWGYAEQNNNKISQISWMKPNAINTHWSCIICRLIQSIKNVSRQRHNGVKFILWQEAFQSNLNVSSELCY